MQKAGKWKDIMRDRVTLVRQKRNSSIETVIKIKHVFFIKQRVLCYLNAIKLNMSNSITQT